MLFVSFRIIGVACTVVVRCKRIPMVVLWCSRFLSGWVNMLSYFLPSVFGGESQDRVDAAVFQLATLSARNMLR